MRVLFERPGKEPIPRVGLNSKPALIPNPGVLNPAKIKYLDQKSRILDGKN